MRHEPYGMGQGVMIVLGAGSTGSFLAGRLARAGVPVSLLGRDAKAVESVTLVESDGERRIALSTKPEWDGATVLLCVKLTDLADALRGLEGRNVREVVLCQNGLGIADEARATLPTVSFSRLICWFGARRTDDGRIRVSGVRGVELAGPASATLGDAFARAQVPVLSSHPEGPLERIEWPKLILNVAMNGLCSIVGAENGAIIEDPSLHAIARRLVDEACAVAGAQGIAVSEEDRARAFEGGSFAARNRNSTLQDLEAGRPTEMRWLNGEIVRRAHGLGMSVPANELITELVAYLERRSRKK